MRLIDADAIIARLHENSKQAFGTDDIPECSAMSVVEDYVDSAPTIDAVPVVRCQKCIYNTDDGYHECIEFGIRIPDDAEFFCKYGKRRKEEHMRLIDADALKYTMLYKENFLRGTGVEAPAVWKSDVDDMPTIDAVPVVRCRECKCYTKDFDENSLNWCCGIGDETKPNDFCLYGQRREEEHNAAD